jgi:phosphatidylethanolamine/phosphatidyl-N-methylethanolamine N-methyltransferase
MPIDACERCGIIITVVLSARYRFAPVEPPSANRPQPRGGVVYSTLLSKLNDAWARRLRTSRVMAADRPHSDCSVHPETAFSNAFIDGVYEKLAPVYDLMFGKLLQPGRRAAVARMGLRPGMSVLEVGVGTGIDLFLYPPDSRITGIDLSSRMLAKARERVARHRLPHVRLCEMDAARLTFADDSFDVVYAPYMISVVPDPGQVAREMRRVCRAGGTILILNHFRSASPLVASVERAIAPVTMRVGFKSDLDLIDVLSAGRLQPRSIEKVNVPRIWSLVSCTKN